MPCRSAADANATASARPSNPGVSRLRPLLFACGWLGLAIESLAAGVGHQLELHPPWRQEIDPALTFARPLARGGFAEHGDPAFAQIRHGGVEVVDVERDVVT